MKIQVKISDAQPGELALKRGQLLHQLAKQLGIPLAGCTCGMAKGDAKPTEKPELAECAAVQQVEAQMKAVFDQRMSKLLAQITRMTGGEG